MWTLLTDGNFWIVAGGTMILGLASGMMGSISVLRGQSLIGDAIGHATFPGIVLAFMLFSTRAPVLLMLGACVTGGVAYALIHWISSHDATSLDTSLAIVLSSFFGVGMVLKSFIEGNPDYADASQAGLSHYIFGQAAFLSKGDLRLIFIVGAVALLFLGLFFKDIKMLTFDREYATVVGHRPKLLNALILIVTLALIAVGLRIVGVILIASMLVAPSVAALQWSSRYPTVVFLSGLFGLVSGFGGTLISSLGRGISTGPTIVIVLSAIVIVSMVFGKRSALRRPKRGTPDREVPRG
ncbi:MAG: metal ABC transporter permease [Saccharofermentanales bacterium]|jgi:manganese/zinc/iron transport system permease protein